MTALEAEALVQKYLDRDVPGFGVAQGSSVESEKCFAVHHQTWDWLRTGSSSDLAIGYGCVIVDKQSGAMYQTGSGLPVAEAIANFEHYGHPYLQPNLFAVEIGLAEGTSVKDKMHAISLLKRIAGITTSEALTLLKAMPAGEFHRIKHWLDQDMIEELGAAGFLVRHPLSELTDEMQPIRV